MKSREAMKSHGAVKSRSSLLVTYFLHRATQPKVPWLSPNTTTTTWTRFRCPSLWEHFSFITPQAACGIRHVDMGNVPSDEVMMSSSGLRKGWEQGPQDPGCVEPACQRLGVWVGVLPQQSPKGVM